MSGGIFVGAEHYLIGGITDSTRGLMMQYSTMMMGLAAGSVTLYILWRGYQTLAGKLTTPMEDVMWDMMRMAIVLSFVANANGYLDGVIDAINGLKDGFSGKENIWQLLDSLWEQTKYLGKTLHDLDESTVVKDEGMVAQLFVWGGVAVLMVICAFVSMIAEIMLLLLGITAPVFIFCLMFGFLRPMFNNWLQNTFSGILTVLFSALSLHIVIAYLDAVLTKAIAVSAQSPIVELGAQVFLAGICAAVLVYFSAKLAAALAGASATASMQGLATIGLGAAFFGASKLASRLTPQPLPNRPLPSPGKEYNATQARRYAIEQITRRNEIRKPPRGH